MAKEDKNKKEGNEEENEPKDGGEAGEAGDAGEGGEGGKKTTSKLTKKKKIILLGGAVLVVIAIAVPAALYLTGHFKKKSAVEAELTAEGGKGVNHTVFYDMEEFLVNLNVGGKRPSFLKMSVSLEVANEIQIPIVEKNMPRIRDNFQVYLRELRQEDLQGSAGLYRLREELLLRVNKVAYPAKVNDILFKEILVQ